MLTINLPDVVAEVAAAYERYEKALAENNIEVLNEIFWNDPLTIRYGPNENLYGHAEIAAFRHARTPTDEPKKRSHRCHDLRHGYGNREYDVRPRLGSGEDRSPEPDVVAHAGRLAGGVRARQWHQAIMNSGAVMPQQDGFDAERYVDAAAALIGLTIAPELRPGVVANFKQIADTAALVMSFPLDDQIDPAVVFRP